jgi:regulator of CtrA degradation
MKIAGEELGVLFRDAALPMETCMAEGRPTPGGVSQPIVFGQRLAGSEVFRAMFKEGMALVEETANYLDGDGRVESRGLTRAGSLAYATESMRLTTRLMQLASWLLLQRAVNDGEMSAEQGSLEKAKVKLNGLASSVGGTGWDGLPQRLRDLIERSIRLQDRVRRLDGSFDPVAAPAPENQVVVQLGRLAQAFRDPGK